ncbi:MAG: EAL domain-containing protein [Desulfuromonadales bacterium]|nr:EAL domain-containing protein [Desulfuromonadales bacterium]
MNLIERILHRVDSFRGKQRLLIMIACFIVLMTSLLCHLFNSYIFFNRESRARLGAMADIVAADVGVALAFSDQNAIARSLISLKADSSIKRLLVLDEQGRVCAYYPQQSSEVSQGDLQRYLKTIRTGIGRQFFVLNPEVERPIGKDGVVLGSVIIEQDESILIHRVYATIGTGFVILLFSLLISYLLAARFANVITEPVIAMAKTMREVSQTKNFSIRVAGSDTEEIGQLAESFNHMLEEIAQRDDDLLERQERLNQQASFDSLTGLPNRSLFGDRLDQAVRRALRTGEKLAVLFIDLDDFKLINDTHGHRTGDLLLQEAASRLENGTRSDDTVARLGGDEFTVFLQDIKSAENALLVASKHRELLLSPYVIEDKQLFVSASIGIALFPEHGVNAETLIKSADTAMYLAKENGKNLIELFSNYLHQKVSERLGLGNDLHRALEQGELELYYQPRIDLRRKKWAGVEALVRWHHPEQGMISPDKFIPLAEQTGLILPIGEWVIRESCRQLSEWHSQGLQIPKVSVNVSPLQLQRQNLVGLVREAVAANYLCSRSLEIEITESALMENLEHSVSVLRELQLMGVVISIDDFGTGYSSLSHLRNLPINILKIDRSFMMQIHESEEDAQILSAIIAMAASLHLEVVAEGIEYSQQEKVVAILGCSEVQGYFYSRPLAADDLQELYESTLPYPGADRCCVECIPLQPPDKEGVPGFCPQSPSRSAVCNGERFCRKHTDATPSC